MEKVQTKRRKLKRNPWRNHSAQMTLKLQMAVSMLAAILIVLVYEINGQFTITDLSTPLPSCDLSACVTNDYRYFRKITYPTWKIHKRTKAVEGSQCESVKFSAFDVTGTTVAFNLTATLQLTTGGQARPGTPRRYFGQKDRYGRVSVFETYDGPLTWKWCLYNYEAGETYISQLCTTTAQGTINGAAFSGYTESSRKAEAAIQSVPILQYYGMKLSTYSNTCPATSSFRRGY